CARTLLLGRQFLNVISPPLHHLPAFREVLGMIVSRPNAVALSVCKLAFDHVSIKPMLIENGAGRTAEAVSGCTRVITHPIKRIEDGVLAHATCRFVLIWENMPPPACERLQFLQDRDRLP